MNKKKNKKWIIREKIDETTRAATEEIAKSLGVLKSTARLLVNRGYNSLEAAGRFIRMEEEFLHDPFMMADMERATERILQAAADGERITVYGDYDVDGVTSVSILTLYLESIGGTVDYYIPNRIGEGYGVSAAAIERIAQKGCTLVITVDTGITANDEIALAADLGVDVVVTDHHEYRGELPGALAVVNPCRPDCPYPFKELAGVGVVFKLVCALEERRYGGERSRLDCVRDICSRYADLVALGTIADVMPIRDENRLIVSFGLKMMEKTQRVGLEALFAASTRTSDTRAASSAAKKTVKKPKITSVFIGYTIAPRINAAGRISSAERAVELLLTDSPKKAREIALELCEINRERQTEENLITEQVYKKINDENDLENTAIIVLEDNGWHHGIIGIVASRVTEKYGLPSILISFEGAMEDGKPRDEDIGKGSGRSVKGINLVDALVFCDDLLVRYGGHELAAGLSVTREMVEPFRRRINEFIKTNYSPELLIPTIEADFALHMGEVNMQFAEEIRLLEPYGVSNPSPVFIMREAVVTEVQPISAGRHTKLVIMQDGYAMVAMCFSFPQAELDIYPGDCVDILFNIDINEYNNQKTVQMIARDIRLSQKTKESLLEMQSRYDDIRAGALILPGESIVPCRDDFVAVYTLVRRELRMGRSTMSHRALHAKLKSGELSTDISYIKLKFIIAIMQELDIMDIREISADNYMFSKHDKTNKTDLEKSVILKKMRRASDTQKDTAGR